PRWTGSQIAGSGYRDRTRLRHGNIWYAHSADARTMPDAGGEGMVFAGAYNDFMAYHLSRRRGERLRRLREGHGHAEREFLERVWWPAFQSFRGLHPEYEVFDFSGRRSYLDFAYLARDLKLALEVDGYGPHVTEVSRWQFIHQLRRQNQLILDGWAVLRFA